MYIYLARYWCLDTHGNELYVSIDKWIKTATQVKKEEGGDFGTKLILFLHVFAGTGPPIENM